MYAKQPIEWLWLQLLEAKNSASAVAFTSETYRKTEELLENVKK